MFRNDTKISLFVKEMLEKTTPKTSEDAKFCVSVCVGNICYSNIMSFWLLQLQLLNK